MHKVQFSIAIKEDHFNVKECVKNPPEVIRSLEQ